MKHQIRQASILALLAICLSTTDITAQELKIGDKLPNLSIHNEYDPGSPYRFQTLNKKLVVLAFWNTMCKGCIRSFSKIDSLQKKYEKDVQFFEVSQESKTEIEEFFQLRKKIRRPDVTFITGDTVLRKLFPHDFVPHHVWLENGSKVVAITSGSSTTDQEIKQFLQGKKPTLPKPDKATPGIWDVPLTANLTSSLDSVYGYYSILLPQLDSVTKLASRSKINGSRTVNRIKINKMGILDMFTEAFNTTSQRFSIRSNNVILEIKDSLNYLPPTDMSKYDSWSRRHGFFYELVVPPSKAGEFFEIMQQDMQKLFDLEARIEKRILPCICMNAKNIHPRLASKGGNVVWGVAAQKDSMMRFRNVSISLIIQRLLQFSRKSAYHLVDETGYRGNVDLDLDRSLIDEFDYKVLAANLAPYGIVLKEKECEVDVLVIKQKEPY